MEKFKAVEKEMKTKAYSKEGLQAAAKMDPKEREKVETCEFLSKMVDELEQQMERMEAELETLTLTMKKGKKGDSAKAERIAEIEKTTERHKWHQSKLELILRILENGGLETEQVKELEEEIRYYVESNGESDYIENDTMYDDLDLQEEEDMFGVQGEMDRVSSHETQSLADDTVDEPPARHTGTLSGKPKSSSVSESSAAARRPSTQMKSPLPALATLNTPLPTAPTASTLTIGSTSAQQLTAAPAAKPAPPPLLPRVSAGEPLKYASAAAAAAASDKSGLGLPGLPAPLSRETGSGTGALSTGLSPVPAAARTVQQQASPAVSHSQPIVDAKPTPAPLTVSAEGPPGLSRAEGKKAAREDEDKSDEMAQPATPSLTNGDTHSEPEEEEPIFHLPSGLSDLLDSFEATKASAFQPLTNPAAQRLFISSGKNCPAVEDSDRPNHYRPQNPYPYTPPHYPQEPVALFDDARLYSRCDADVLFYSFYYKQGTYQQYAAAKALKSQSWRFHKQYQTWFQRHEEPKDITEEYEHGTYRFFDYESTW
jgi:CCR4-NOT transcription complex subunit 3